MSEVVGMVAIAVAFIALGILAMYLNYWWYKRNLRNARSACEELHSHDQKKTQACFIIARQNVRNHMIFR